jgi:hypothetical protein
VDILSVDNFDTPEIPNEQTAKQLADSKRQIIAGDYHHFNDNQEALKFLADELSVEPLDKPLEKHVWSRINAVVGLH